MTKFEEFFNQNNNKFLEVVDPTNKYQCFDLVVGWADKLSIPRVFKFLYAYQIYSSFGPTQAQHFTRIFNGPNDIPKEGDILVWSYYYNYSAGHTAVCQSADINRVRAFSQNDPVGKPCILRDYSYSNILGWLRPKVYLPAPLPLTWEQKGRKTIEIVNGLGSDSDKVQLVRKVYGV